MCDVVVGIDTSNYTTSLAIASTAGDIIANLKILLPVASGDRGLRQSDAVFAHIKNIPMILDKASEFLDDKNIKAVGFSATPRDVEGSYMPCFLCGEIIAKSIALQNHLPIYKSSHQSGHIMAALYSAKAEHLLKVDQFVAFHVSGGTTEILLVKNQDSKFNIDIIGETLDLNAGQLIDRVGVMMGLPFPAGPELEKLSFVHTNVVYEKKSKVTGFTCNLSGLENLATKYYLQDKDATAVAVFILDSIERTLFKISQNIRKEYIDIPILYSGGVMSNSRIKKGLSKISGTYFAEPAFSADNAAGTALLCLKAYSNDQYSI